MLIDFILCLVAPEWWCLRFLNSESVSGSAEMNYIWSWFSGVSKPIRLIASQIVWSAVLARSWIFL